MNKNVHLFRKHSEPSSLFPFKNFDSGCSVSKVAYVFPARPVYWRAPWNTRRRVITTSQPLVSMQKKENTPPSCIFRAQNQSKVRGLPAAPRGSELSHLQLSNFGERPLSVIRKLFWPPWFHARVVSKLPNNKVRRVTKFVCRIMFSPTSKCLPSARLFSHNHSWGQFPVKFSKRVTNKSSPDESQELKRLEKPSFSITLCLEMRSGRSRIKRMRFSALALDFFCNLIFRLLLIQKNPIEAFN